MTTMKIIKFVLLTGLLMFMWEHVARQNNIETKPSIFLERLAEVAKDTFTFVGKLWAMISSFYTWIDLTEVYQTLDDLTKPLLKLGVSPFFMIRGYFDVMYKYKNPIMIGCGSLTLFLVGLLAYGKWMGNNYYYSLIGKSKQSKEGRKVAVATSSGEKVDSSQTPPRKEEDSKYYHPGCHCEKC